MDKKIKVLLVEDEDTLVVIITETLQEKGFDIVTADNGEDGLKLFYKSKPDILVVDVMMPKLDGFKMVQQIREIDKITPILFMTARSSTKDVVEGFELGANDYLKKPFGVPELIVRIKSLVGRLNPIEEQTSFNIGQFLFDNITQKLIYDSDEIELSHRESEILKRLSINMDHIVNTKSLLLELWEDDNFFNNRSLHVFITKLRNKLSKDKNIEILNIRGVGYKLVVNSSREIKGLT